MLHTGKILAFMNARATQCDYVRWSDVTLDYGSALASGSSGVQMIVIDNGTHIIRLPEDKQINTR